MLYPTGLSGLKLLSESDYQNLDPPIENTFYIVKGEEVFSLFLGSLPLPSSGGSAVVSGLAALAGRSHVSNIPLALSGTAVLSEEVYDG